MDASKDDTSMGTATFSGVANLIVARTFTNLAPISGQVNSMDTPLIGSFYVQAGTAGLATGTMFTLHLPLPTQGKEINLKDIKTGVATFTAFSGAIAETLEFPVDLLSTEPISAEPTATVSTSAIEAASSGARSPEEPTALPTSSGATSRGSAGASSGVSPGAVAGGVIGGLVAGAILAALLVFFLMRKRYRRRQASRLDNEKVSPAKGPVYAAEGGWEGHLPQEESDATIRRSANRVLDSIEGHVESYYKNANAQFNPDTQSKLLGLETHLSTPLVNLLSQSSRPTTVIKHCIASLVISEISTAEGGRGSFLPGAFSSLQTSSATSDETAFAPALSRWRVLTAYLNSDSADEARRAHSINEAAQQITQAFAPWARKTQDRERMTQHLIGVMKQASELGVLLFSQPAALDWQWQDHDPPSQIRSTAEIVVLPGLFKSSPEPQQTSGSWIVEPRMGAA